MSAPRLILCEQRGVWARAVARHLPAKLPLRQTRGQAECLAELDAAPRSLVCVELTRANFAGVLDLLGRVRRQAAEARSVVLTDASLAPWEWDLREAGALHVVTSPRDPRPLVRLVERHLARLPVARTSLATQVWNSLPWDNPVAP